jgi:hypothetical protein
LSSSQENTANKGSVKSIILNIFFILAFIKINNQSFVVK